MKAIDQIKKNNDLETGGKRKIINDVDLRESPYTSGLIIKPGPKAPKITKGLPAGRAIELIAVLNEAGYMTLGSVTIVLRCSRQRSKDILNKLLKAGLIEYSEVVTETGMFHLWQITGTPRPLTAQEGCRLAVLSIFYSLMRNQVKNFQWRVFRNTQTKSMMAEMNFWHEKEGRSSWVIDVPRKGEKRLDSADLYIFPDIKEAKFKTPAGKLYIADNVIYDIKPEDLKGKIMMKKP